MPSLDHQARPSHAGRSLACLLLATVVAACSGSGSSSSSTSVSVAPTSLSFTGTYGAGLPASQMVIATFEGDGVLVGTPPGVNMPTWLTVDKGSVSGKNASFTVRVNAQARPGTQSTILRFVTGRLHGDHLDDVTDMTWVDLPVTSTVVDDLAVSPAQLTLTPNDGSLATRKIQVSLASGSGGVAWTATVDAGLHLASSSGDAATPVEVSYESLAQPLAAGATTRNVQVSAVISGKTVTRTVPVSLDVGPHRIYAARNGVAFTSAPGVRAVEAAIPLMDNAGVTTGTWSAVADQPWLVVDGIHGDLLALRADPSGLAEGLHYATLTVSSSGPRVEAPEHVRVGLYVSSATPVQGQLATNAGQVPVPDPIRPWVWLIEEDRSKVSAYNVYSGAVEKRLSLPAPVTAVAVSGDGSLLYGGGMTVSGGYADIARVIIDTGAALPAFTAQGSAVVATLRPLGKEFVATSAGDFFDAASGARTGGASAFDMGYGWKLAVSADQRHVFGINNGLSPTPLALARLDVSGAASALSVTSAGSTSILNELGVGRIAATPDGSAVVFPDHRAGATANPFGVFGPDESGALVSLGTFLGSTAADPTIAVDVAPDGRVIAVSGATVDCWDSLLGTITHSYGLPSAKNSPWSIRFSGDGERAILAGFADGSTQALWAYPSR